MYDFLYTWIFKLCIPLNSNKVTVPHPVMVNVNKWNEESDLEYPTLIFIAVINTWGKGYICL